MSRCIILLKNIWLSGHHSFHPRLHYIRTRNDCPGSSEISAWVLSTTAGVRSSRCVLSNDFSSLAYWNLHWTVLKPYILPQYKRLISGIQRIISNYLGCWAPSAKAFDDRGSSIILRTWFQHRSHFENMTTRSIRLSQTPTISGEDTIKNVNLNLFRFWWHTLYNTLCIKYKLIL